VRNLAPTRDILLDVPDRQFNTHLFILLLTRIAGCPTFASLPDTIGKPVIPAFEPLLISPIVFR